jgi:hypothetical protein
MAKIQLNGVVYDPELALSEITNVEGIAIEKAMNMTFDQWTDQLAKGSMQAMTALVWFLQKKDNPQLRISEVVFKMSDVKPIKEETDEPVTPGVAPEVVPGGRQAEVPNSETVDSQPVEAA